MRENYVSEKIISNSTEKTWSQVYSTLNLFVVISIEDIGNEEARTEPIASHGKTVLEKLQREFFAIEKKNLSNVKRAVEKTVGTIESNIEYSIVVAAMVKNAFYIITAGEAMVLIKRGTKTGIAAQGEKQKVISFSGFIEHDDIIIIQTGGFVKKLPPAKLSDLIGNQTVFDVAENIAPIIHGNSTGTEAAIIIQSKHNFSTEENPSEEEHPADKTVFSEKNQNTDEIGDEEEESVMSVEEKLKLPDFLKLPFYLKNIFEKQFLQKKKIFIFALIIVLTGVFIAGIALEKKKEEDKKIARLSADIITSAQAKYDEAETFWAFNKDSAYKDLSEAKSILNDGKKKFKEGSKERNNIENLLKLVNEKIDTLNQGTAIKDQKVLLQTSDNKDLGKIGQISLKTEEIILSNQQGTNVFTISQEGKINNKFSVSLNNISSLTGNDEFIYILSQSGISQINKKSKKTAEIIKTPDASSITAVDIFLGNIYLLNQTEKNIDKYTSSKYVKSTYLENSLTQEPLSFAIDGSVWVLLQNNTVKKFTKGKEDEFSIKGMPSRLSKDSIIYTDQKCNNIYILDRENQKIYLLNKKGEYQNHYNLKVLEKIHSFAVDEINKKIFVASDNKLYSFSY